MRIHARVLASVAGLLAGVSVTAASAATYSYTSYGVFGQVVDITGPNPFGSGYASQISLTGPTGTITTWCADTAGQLLGSGTYTVLPASDLAGQPGVPSVLTWTQIGEIGGLKLYGDERIAGGAGADVAAAVALAIWTVEYENVDGGFAYSPTNPLVSSLLTNVGDGTIPLFYGFHVLEEAGNQTLITDSIPEPSTWAMLLIGFAGIGFAGFRKAKARAAFAKA